MSAKKTKPSEAVKPQVIDLDPESVVDITSEDVAPDPKPEAAAKTESFNAATASDPETSRPEDNQHQSYQTQLKIKPKTGYAWPLAALIAGAVGGGWFYRDVIASYFPSNQVETLATKVAALEGANTTLTSDLGATRQLIEQLKNDTDLVEADLGTAKSAALSAQQQQEASVSRLATLEKQIGDIGSQIASLGSTAGAGTTSTTPTLEPSVLAGLKQRIDALEAEVAALKSAAPKPSDTSALSQSLSDLKARISEGAPFAAEFTRIEQIVPAAEGLTDLKAFAELGLPTAQGLATEIRGIAPTLPKPAAATPDSEKGYWESFTGLFSDVVKVRDIGATNWPELAEKCATLAEANDLTQAIQLIADAEGDVPLAVIAWRDRAAGRLQLEAAIARTSEAVMRQIAAKG